MWLHALLRCSPDKLIYCSAVLCQIRVVERIDKPCELLHKISLDFQADLYAISVPLVVFNIPTSNRHRIKKIVVRSKNSISQMNCFLLERKKWNYSLLRPRRPLKLSQTAASHVMIRTILSHHRTILSHHSHFRGDNVSGIY